MELINYVKNSPVSVFLYVIMVLVLAVIFELGKQYGLHCSMKSRSIGTLKIPLVERTEADRPPAIELKIDTPLEDLPKEDYVSILLSIIEEE